MPDLRLTGFDGSNPLSFMAALGVLNAVSDVDNTARLTWHDEGAWRPILRSSCDTVDVLVSLLDNDRTACEGDAALGLCYDDKRDLKPPPSLFRHYLAQLVHASSAATRRSVDWASSFGTDVATDNNGNTKPTALHFTAGPQQFLQMAHDLVTHAAPPDLQEAVLGPWTYTRALPVMGWDSTASRDYALRAKNPSTDKKLGVPGADWLAIRSLSFFPTAPVGNRIHTTACFGGWKDGDFRWPIWTRFLSRPVIRSLVSARADRMSSPERTARGITTVFSCGIRRSDQGGYGSFGPARVVIAAQQTR